MLRVVKAIDLNDSNEFRIMNVLYPILDETHLLICSDSKDPIAYGTKENLVNYVNSLGIPNSQLFM